MTGKVHSFDGKVGGGYEMSLFYSDSDEVSQGKTTGKEDRFTARFMELTPPSKIVESIRFHSPDSAFGGEMTMEVAFESEGDGTRVTVVFRNLPPGIEPEDNEAGTDQTLAKLAHFMERGRPGKEV